jgi:hypothetical protein
MQHSAEFLRSVICYSALYNSMWNSSQKFSCSLRSMPHSGESRLCAMRYSEELRLRAMQHSEESRLLAIRHSVKSIFVVEFIEYLREFESICKTVLAHESWDPGVQFNEKTEGRKSLETVPLSFSRFLEISWDDAKCLPYNIMQGLW